MVENPVCPTCGCRMIVAREPLKPREAYTFEIPPALPLAVHGERPRTGGWTAYLFNEEPVGASIASHSDRARTTPLPPLWPCDEYN